jgi:hypothetical protein
VWGVTLVKDEIDVIELSLRHQLAQGLDAIVVADNGSTDGTLELLTSLAGELPLHVTTDSWTAYYQGIKMTRLASMARRAGADWIVPFDADELWFARDGTLAEHLRASGATVVGADLYNLFPVTEQPPAREVPMRLDLTPSPYKKVAFRSQRLASISTGNHYAYRSGPRAEGLVIAHLPWRSLAQLRRKATQGATALRATELPAQFGSHWRQLAELDEAELERRWHDVLEGTPVEGLVWGPVGPFVKVSALGWDRWDPDRVVPPT